MTCYQRHLGWMFEALGVPYDTAHRTQVDAALKEVLGLPSEAHCPEVWAGIKALPEGDLEAMLPDIGARVGS